MADRVRSDHPSIPTLRGRLVRRGGTRRPAVAVSADDGGGDADEAANDDAGRPPLPAGGTIRLVIDGAERRAPVVERGEDRLVAGAYDDPRRARERDGSDRLAEWVETRAIEFGRTVLVDVVEPGEAYGLRLPGEEAVYEVDRGPTDSLRRIAEDLES